MASVSTPGPVPIPGPRSSTAVEIRPGARVTHPTWGAGVVTRMVNGGRHWIVTLDGKPSTPVALPAREFSVIQAPEGARIDSTKVPVPTPDAVVTEPAVPDAVVPDAVVPSPASHDTRESSERADVRQALEALRLGVVPPQGLSRLTVGRDVEQGRLRTLVDNARGMLVLSGGYGAGKTHLVELAEAEALASNMLVARATFDPQEVPPSHPLRIYAALMTGLRYPEGPGRGLAPLFDRLAASATHTQPSGASAHRWLTPALWAHATYPGGTLAAELLEWVQGAPHDKEALSHRLLDAGWRGRPLLVLPDWRTFGQVMAHMLGGIATWARDAGWSGLLVLLDEAEYFDHLDTTARGMAENVLRFLAMASLPDAELPFDPSSVYRGGHAVHKDVSPRFREDQPLAVMCAFTPNPRINDALPNVVRPLAVLHLEPIHASTFPRLADNVLQIVRDAHPGLTSNAAHEHMVKRALASAWEEGRVTNTRQAARMLVEHWDLYRDDPSRAVRALRQR